MSHYIIVQITARKFQPDDVLYYKEKDKYHLWLRHFDDNVSLEDAVTHGQVEPDTRVRMLLPNWGFTFIPVDQGINVMLKDSVEHGFEALFRPHLPSLIELVKDMSGSHQNADYGYTFLTLWNASVYEGEDLDYTLLGVIDTTLLEKALRPVSKPVVEMVPKPERERLVRREIDWESMTKPRRRSSRKWPYAE
jgi:hypothetical protein